MDAEQYPYDSCFAEDDLLRDLAERYGTPFYLYDAAGFETSLRELHEAFRWSGGFREYFPASLLPAPQLAGCLHRLGDGLLCCDLQDLRLAEVYQFDPERILFAPMVPTREELLLAKKLGAGFVVDNLASLRAVMQVYRPERCVLRLNCGEKIRVGGIAVVRGEKSKLGMNPEELMEAAGILTESGLKQVGLEMRVLQTVADAGYLAEMLRLLLVCGARLESQDLKISQYILGGTLAVAYKPGMPEASLLRAGEAACELWQQSKLAEGRKDAVVSVSLGKRLLAHHGILVSKVLLKKSLERTYLVLDAYVTPQNRSSLNSYHHISVVGNTSRRGRVFADVVGAWSESDDRFGERRVLPPMEPGDLCVIHDVGCLVERTVDRIPRLLLKDGTVEAAEGTGPV